MRLALLLLIATIAFAGEKAVVRSIRFADFQGVSVDEILDRLNEREVRLAVEKPYRPEDAREARHYIAQLLAEKGRPDARIEIATKVVARRRVEVQFRLVK
jgi:outer membrane protein assembly factor BamA